MKISLIARVVLLVSPLGALGCDGDGGAGAEVEEECGTGFGYPVEFCSEISDYSGGVGVRGTDMIDIDCIVGPEDGTVYESSNGPYHASGRYWLATAPSATISLAWGGTTTFRGYEDAVVPSGQGTFDVALTKISGGDGNMFIEMFGDSALLLAKIPINEACPAASAEPCVPGQTDFCQCTEYTVVGARTCQSDGSFSACDCDTI